jgi:hypothetical protein
MSPPWMTSMPEWTTPATLLRVVQTDLGDMDTDQLLLQVQRSHQFQRLLNTVMIMGLVSVLVLTGILLSQRGKQSTAIVQLTSSLGQTCDQTNTGVLPAAVQVDCDRAQRGELPEVVQGITGPAGAAGPTGAAGAAGAEGKPGEGITGMVVDPATGHLIVTYSGGSKVDLGAVMGKDGTSGIPGLPGAGGRGIASVTIVDGRFQVSYTDGTTADAGAAPVGPAGRDGVDGQNGTDGQNGADGRNGSPAASITITRTDGTTVVCPRTDGSPDDAPAYTCTPQ